MTLCRLICIWIILCFLSLNIFPNNSFADSLLNLPQAGSMVNLSPVYTPILIKGLRIHPENPFLFDFILDTGDSSLNTDSPQLRQETERLIKYFLVTVAIPEKNLWVNLSPFEKDRMIPKELGQTELGRDMLAQDYILKQLTASLIYPEKELGKKFWDKVYTKARQMYGDVQVPVNTFNKVWIVADRADVFVHDQTAYIVGSHLKVMLEEDYLALQKNSSSVIANQVSLRSAEGGESIPKRTTKNRLPRQANSEPRNDTSILSSQIIRQIILPELEREVNQGQNFSILRQMFHSMILAAWYKNNIKTALLNQVYANKLKLNGVEIDDQTIKDKIYQQYLQAYKKGVFNYIKEDMDKVSRQPMPRKYFSGGLMDLAIAHQVNNPGGLEPNGKVLDVAVQVIKAVKASPKREYYNPKQKNSELNLEADMDLKVVFTKVQSALNDFGRPADEWGGLDLQAGRRTAEQLRTYITAQAPSPALNQFVKDMLTLAFSMHKEALSEDDKVGKNKAFLLHDFIHFLNENISGVSGDKGVRIQYFLKDRSAAGQGSYVNISSDKRMDWIVAETIKGIVENHALRHEKEIIHYLMGKIEHDIPELAQEGVRLGFSPGHFYEGINYLTGLKKFKPNPEGEPKKWTSFIPTYHEDGTPTGKVKSYFEVKKDRDWHQAASVFILSSNKRKLFLQIRPDGSLEVSAAGSTDIGHTGLQTALKEVEEELHLKLRESRLFPIVNQEDNSPQRGLFHFDFNQDPQRRFDENGILFAPARQHAGREIFKVFVTKLVPNQEKKWRKLNQGHIISWSNYLKLSVDQLAQSRKGTRMNEEVHAVVEVDVHVLMQYFKEHPEAVAQRFAQGLHGLMDHLSFRKQLVGYKDDAKISQIPRVAEPGYGGIDLDAGHMQMKVQGENIGVKFDPAMVAQFQEGNFSGVQAVIIRITPVVSLPPLLGLSPRREVQLT